MAHRRIKSARALLGAFIAAYFLCPAAWLAAQYGLVDGPLVPDEGIVLVAGPSGPAALPPVSKFQNRAILLCWHTFLGVASVPTDFSLPELASQIDAIRALGYRFVDLEDALSGRLEGNLNVVATIDDGHRTVPLAVEKVFLPRGIRPTLFIYPAVIGTTSFAMDDYAVQRLGGEGCWIGSHGYHHLFVNEELYRSDRADFDKEIYKGKLKTEEIIDLPVLAFAYPYGALSEVTKIELRRAGYAFGIGAFGSVQSGFVYADSALNDEYELPRLVVTKDNWPALRALLERNATARSEP
jgi:peptidoglycan/xylan/chitin deacetylase (PgdA/CDA1 family)